MTATTKRSIAYVRDVLQNGLEGYNKEAVDTITKGVENPGGAKIFWHLGFRTNTSRIQILNPTLRTLLLTELRVLLATVNRIQLNEQGEPVRVPGAENNYNRVNHGLMLYPNLNDSEKVALQFKTRIIEALKEKEQIDLSDYVITGAELPSDIDISCLKELKWVNFAREMLPVNPRSCIFLALPSGGEGGAQFWTYKSKKQESRGQLARASVDTSQDFPF